MGEFDSYLPRSNRETLLRERISRFALEGYQYELNLKFAIETNDEEGIQQAREAIESLKLAIKMHEEQLQTLKENVE
jgi:hypothetical protein